ncbi:hypothetical protein P43SY_009525 [Pythium insidiosum]|uniref:Uncharacterized protein n=1 Tax=Pythium insidiosum TaxID=114742 RepID=A0AAD5M0S2_PYTIN|nr:hypothetical protein P43SY_009525 [Pythium insidiosum]
MLFSSLLHVIKADSQAYLLSTQSASETSQRMRDAFAPAASPSASASARRTTKKTTSKAAAAPTLRHWSFLRNELARLHTKHAPTLHLDPNGRECLHQLAAFALAVVSRARGAESALESDIRTQAWQMLELVVRLRVYCAVLDQSQLEDALDLSLALLSDSAKASASEVAACAMVLQRVVAHSPYDLDAAAGRIWATIATWLGQQGRYILEHGLTVWRYLQRTWKSSVARLHPHRADFVEIFVQVCDQLLTVKSNPSPYRLRRELGGLLSILLNPKELQNVLLSSKIIRGGAASLAGLNELEEKKLSPANYLDLVYIL